MFRIIKFEKVVLLGFQLAIKEFYPEDARKLKRIIEDRIPSVLVGSEVEQGFREMMVRQLCMGKGAYGNLVEELDSFYSETVAAQLYEELYKECVKLNPFLDYRRDEQIKKEKMIEEMKNAILKQIRGG